MEQTMIKCCIFDLDGTLLNTLETIRFYVNKTLLRYGLSPINEEECRSFVGSGARVLMTKAFSSRGAEIDERFEKAFLEYLSDYDGDPYYLTEKYEGIDELISELKGRGILLAVLSNKPDFATNAAIRRFFGDRFSVVHGGRDNIPLKPASDGCFDILSELSVTAEECAYIGDSDVDVLTAKNMNAGLKIAVSWGFRTKAELISAGAEIILDSPSEILSYFK